MKGPTQIAPQRTRVVRVLLLVEWVPTAGGMPPTAVQVPSLVELVPTAMRKLPMPVRIPPLAVEKPVATE